MDKMLSLKEIDKLQEERETIEAKARKKGWIVKGLSTERPIDCYISKKDFKRWQNILVKLNILA